MMNKQDDDAENKTTVWTDHLSEELCMQILSFLPPLEILRSVTKVSKSLHAVADPQSYWLFHAKALYQNLCRQRNLDDDPSCWLDHDHDDHDDDDDVELLLNRHQLQRICVFLAAQSSSSSKSSNDTISISISSSDQPGGPQFPAGLHYGSRLVNRAGAKSIRQHQYHHGNNTYNNIMTLHPHHRRRVCLASSTEHPTELLENVLGSLGNSWADEVIQNLGVFDLRQQFQKWWSSRPSPTPESADTILFTTNCPLALLSDMKWRPLLDPFTRRQAYTWRHAIVKAYRLPLSKLDPHPDQARAGFPCTVEALPDGVVRRRDHHHVDDASTNSTESEGDDTDLSLQSARQEKAALDRLLQGELAVFESPPLPYTLLPQNVQTYQHCIPWQHLIFPPGLLANVVTITLVGKDSRQFQHSGYYACVEQVKLEGIPVLKGVYESEFAERASNGFAQQQQQEE
jgi:hypothetical protein